MKHTDIPDILGLLATGAPPPPAPSPLPRPLGTMRQAGKLVKTQIFQICLKVLVRKTCAITDISYIFQCFGKETL